MLKVYINPETVMVNGKPLEHKEKGAALLTELYRNHIGDYPKFFKMDSLSKLGFMASELLLQAEGGQRFEPREDRAVIFFNKSASLQADTAYQATIQDAENFFPSPAAFVYTLPNIVTGKDDFKPVCGSIAFQNGIQALGVALHIFTPGAATVL